MECCIDRKWYGNESLIVTTNLLLMLLYIGILFLIP